MGEIKLESAKVIWNVAKRFPAQAIKSINYLVQNAENR